MEEKLSNCPICRNSELQPFLKVKDHFLSNEEFSIQACNNCGFRFVNPRPDKNDIGRYYQSDEYISHDSKNTDLFSRIYKIVRKFSIKGKFRIVKSFCRDGKILDIGCGTGEFLHYCHQKGFEIAGIEPNYKAREFAKSNNGVPAYENLEKLIEFEGGFNCITMWHVLEHVHNLDELFIQVKKLLAPEGVFIVAVPNSNSWDASYYKTFWAAYDVPRHLYHFTKGTMTQLAEGNKFEIRKIYPQKLDAYYVSMLSEKYKNGKPSYLTSVFHGFRSNCNAKNKERGHSSMIFILSVKNT
jgi:2-polyprenyl-3-methyl-5-hydroxy-6-metoxy-1,4-benzoquinol methylase